MEKRLITRKPTDEINIREVSDLNLASFLISAGHKLVGPASFRDRFITFRFEKTPELEQDCLNFFLKNAKVDALTLCETLRNIKTMVQELK